MKDPIVEGIRQVRDAHAKQFNCDLAAICNDLRQREKSPALPTVTLPPKRLGARRLQPNVPDTVPGNSGSLDR